MKNNTEKAEEFLRLIEKGFPVPLSQKQGFGK